MFLAKVTFIVAALFSFANLNSAFALQCKDLIPKSPSNSKSIKIKSSKRTYALTEVDGVEFLHVFLGRVSQDQLQTQIIDRTNKNRFHEQVGSLQMQVLSEPKKDFLKQEVFQVIKFMDHDGDSFYSPSMQYGSRSVLNARRLLLKSDPDLLLRSDVNTQVRLSSERPYRFLFNQRVRLKSGEILEMIFPLESTAENAFAYGEAYSRLLVLEIEGATLFGSTRLYGEE